MYNPFKWHVVTRGDGKFAMRRWFFGWEFKDQINTSYNWRMSSRWFDHCWLEEKDKLRPQDIRTWRVN
jgi:hypothetical protein